MSDEDELPQLIEMECFNCEHEFFMNPDLAGHPDLSNFCSYSCLREFTDKYGDNFSIAGCAC